MGVIRVGRGIGRPAGAAFSGGGGGGGGGGTTPNLAALPVGAGQARDTTAYSAVAPSAGNGSYLDPVTGVRVWRATSASYPATNTGSQHNYSEGPNTVSTAWGAALDQHTLCCNVEGQGFRFADFQRGVGFSNWRTAPADFQFTSFSNVPGTARIAYYLTVSGTTATITRYDTAGMAAAPSGAFPKNITVVGTGAVAWFQHDRNDRWFSFQRGETVYVWDSQTDTLLTARTFTGIDEHYLDLDGTFVLINDAPTTGTIWRLSDDTTTSYATLTNQNLTHVPSLRAFWATMDPNSGGGTLPRARVPAVPSGTGQAVIKSFTGYVPDGHSSGWVQGAADTTQFMLYSNAHVGSNWGNGGETVGNALVYVPLDGAQSTRLLCHVYSDILGANYNYWASARAQVSPDGRVAVFGSNMLVGGGRYDVHLVEVPLG